ncbi:peptide chain release factor 2 [Sulfobacillus harzensis]|uniref:Peptide chain release factor 2 n=1 Tax=Sulfobacillus harzensis TaxID=2729629 RepID=A0A7Y0Q2A7_9FIRM|nr:peptide chain release factor 2 [Sulfobacillus harzensis]NMP20989.1 peptide chain release factor 2 [Sulfobacillus harzensis]
MIQDDILQYRESMAELIDRIRGSLDPANRIVEREHLEHLMAEPDFWSDTARAERITKQLRVVSGPLEQFDRLSAKVEDWVELGQLALQEGDAELLRNQVKEAEAILSELRSLELTLILQGPYDHESALLTLHAGAGGTEAQDWVEMLLRMYLRWAEHRGFQTRIIDELPGEEAGLKSVSVEVKGENAFGFLRAERGVHRLVRISPFDASGRRHTSFASVEVVPDIEDDESIEIRPEDLRVDTYRASGAGGQHINKTESAVRITHLPTGIVVSCQSERSQHSNRETAMKMLLGKLAELKEREWEQKMAEVRGIQTDIGWGSQIRSYVFQPYTVVRDHRTRFEVGNVQAVMDGEIDGFIEAYLQGEARGSLTPEEADS